MSGGGRPQGGQHVGLPAAERIHDVGAEVAHMGGRDGDDAVGGGWGVARCHKLARSRDLNRVRADAIWRCGAP